MSNEVLAPPTRLIRMRELRKRVPLSRTRIYELMNDGRFPKCVKLSQRASAWFEADIEQWLGELRKHSCKVAP
jgi:prophage regulatory protein